MTWELTIGDLYPPLPGILTDSNGPVDIGSGKISGVSLLIKANSGSITGAATVLQVAFTANTTQNSAGLANVSAFTNIWAPGLNVFESGSTIYGPGIPAPTKVDDEWTLPSTLAYDSDAKTITMDQPASANGTGVSLIANIGCVQYSWVSGDTDAGSEGTYAGGWQVTWASGSKPQFFPSSPADQINVTLNPLP